MALITSSRGASAFLGSFVADCASLPIHWVYAKDAILAAAPPSEPFEFRPRIATSWHALRKTGQPSMYGEGALVMASALAAKEGKFNLPHFRAQWQQVFGPCGLFQGYCDKTTKHTVFQYMKLNQEEEKNMYPQSKEVNTKIMHALFPKLASLVEDAYSAGGGNEALAAVVTAACKAANPDGCNEATLTWALAAASAMERVLTSPTIGADDNQSNALGKLVPVAIAYAGKSDFATVVEASIRATQNNDEAVQWFLPLARMIESVVTGTAKTAKEAVEAGLPYYTIPAQKKTMEEAVAAASKASSSSSGDDEASIDTTVSNFGQACAASSTAPNIVYFLLRHNGNPTYTQALRENALAGGENCARACIIGAILGGLQGVVVVAEESSTTSGAGGGGGAGVGGVGMGIPQSWIEKVAADTRARMLELAAKFGQ